MEPHLVGRVGEERRVTVTTDLTRLPSEDYLVSRHVRHQTSWPTAVPACLSCEHLQLSPLSTAHYWPGRQARSCQYSANYKNCLSLKCLDMKTFWSYTEIELDPAAAYTTLHSCLYRQREIFNTEIKVCWQDKSLQQPGNLNNTAAKERKGRHWTGLTVQFVFSLEASYLLDCPGLWLIVGEVRRGSKSSQNEPNALSSEVRITNRSVSTRWRLQCRIEWPDNNIYWVGSALPQWE